MEKIQSLEPSEEYTEDVEERKEIPFGVEGAAFLRNLTQHAVFLGFTALLLMIVRIFGAK